ncbi:zinc finger protein GAI-ASSOCIATED FACTOR 1-like [Tasmannia lanceolata]|uniref:zinc finger protein GAI-ASSOCIATED FACTOR 1-like n=1 Tax=Tasmannia lanceolata TaxID=3420 RepID=UPI00406321C0
MESMELDNSMATSASGEASVSSSGQQVAAPVAAPAKKKRSLPGMPDPDAEVIALSPKTLMATNRFVCEICNKGFQRDQNLQLHRRGHNLPWKLRQRSSNEIRKRVYVCPETSCVHHDPSRALGDLTGIKKHFCRKHGEKKWKCEKCSKKYAVQSDWKAHSKTCGTREYRCDCGTLFSRRDSFITHRAFCDALAEESAKAQTVEEDPKLKKKDVGSSAVSSPRTAVVPSVLPIQQREPENQPEILQLPPPPATVIGGNTIMGNSTSGNSSNLFASILASASTSSSLNKPHNSSAISDLFSAMTRSDNGNHEEIAEPTSLCLSSRDSTLFSPLSTTNSTQNRPQFAIPSPHMSATALLQKAAQMGAAASSASLLRGFGLSSSNSSAAQQEQQNLPWNHRMIEPESTVSGLGLGLPYDGVGFPELMGQFGPKPTTLDLLGLGMGGGATAGGLSALITSMGSGLDVSNSFGGGNSPGKSWEGPERKPNTPALM